MWRSGSGQMPTTMDEAGRVFTRARGSPSALGPRPSTSPALVCPVATRFVELRRTPPLRLARPRVSKELVELPRDVGIAPRPDRDREDAGDVSATGLAEGHASGWNGRQHGSDPLAKRRDVPRRRRPHDVPVDPEGGVDRQVAERHDVLPGNVIVRVAELASRWRLPPRISSR